MSTLLTAARRGMTAVLEVYAKDENLRPLADGIEDDMASMATLLKRLTGEHLAHKDIQDVFAHLVDHVIGESLELAGETGDPEEVYKALDEYVYRLEGAIERKSPIKAEKLRNTFENFWDDEDESDDEGEGSEDSPGEEEKGDPGPKRSRPDPAKDEDAPEEADVDGTMEVEEE